MNFKNIGFLLSTAVALSSYAFADEIRVRDQAGETKCAESISDNWKGFSLGLNAGALFNVSREGHHAHAHHSKNLGGTAFTGGIQLGYNYHFSYFYIGLETDFNYSSLNKSHTSNWVVDGVATHVHYKDKLNWFGTVRPRLGVAWDTVILYVTGGFSYGHLKAHEHGDIDGVPFSHGMSKTAIGWNVGAGLEWCFVKHWSFRLEYLFLDLAKKDDLKNRNHIARAGINYLF
ncbi:MAG: outer membrane protein [Chlamydiota bacterium]